jgi:hypothetical protein
MINIFLKSLCGLWTTYIICLHILLKKKISLHLIHIQFITHGILLLLELLLIIIFIAL